MSACTKQPIILTQIIVVLVITVALCAVSISGPANHSDNLNTSFTALHGYDAVSYFTGRPEQGLKAHVFEENGAKYLFVSKENLEKFRLDPGKYIPAFGGWCAWAMLDGEKVDIDPERYKIIDGVNYLFYDGFWGNTLKKWNNLAKDRGEKALVLQADKQWAQILEPKQND